MDEKLDTTTIDAWAALLRFSRLMLESVESDLKRADLPPLVWYDVLWELRKHQKTGLRQSEISEQMLLAKHNLSRLVDRLESQDLVERIACPDDGRSKSVHIKKGGIELLKRMWPIYETSIEQHFGSQLSVSDKRTLTKTLRNVNS